MSKPLKPRRGTTAEHAAFIGQAHEVTYDTDKQTLVCHDGLTAGGFPLARADEVAAKDAAQDAAIAGKLDKSGGTMTGPIRHNNVDTVLRAAGDGWQTRISGGSSGWGTGGIVTCYGVGSSDVPGGVRIAAMQPGTSGSKALTLMYDLESQKWKLVWGNSDVLTSEGGTMAYSSRLNFNPYGQIRVTGDAASYGLTFFSDADDFNATCLRLYSKNITNSNTKGFSLQAGDGTTTCELRGRCDKTLTWGGNPVLTATSMPDYSAGVTVSSGFTAPSAGLYRHSGFNVTGNTYVNGVIVDAYSWSSGGWAGHAGCTLLLSKGDVITYTGTAPSNRAFFPLKGV